MSKAHINVELFARNASNQVTSIAQEWHTNMQSAICAAKRLAGTRRQMRVDGDALRITGKNGTAWVIS